MPAQITEHPITQSTGEADGALGKILGAVELRLVLVKLRDGHGQEQVKVALALSTGEPLYFLDDKAIDLHPLQQWVKKQVRDGLSSKLDI